MTQAQGVPSIFAPPPGENPSYAPPTATATPYTPSYTPASTSKAAPSSTYTPTAAAVPTSYNPTSTATPPNAGTDHNLPPNIRDIAKPRSQVIAWSHLDPALEKEISRYICCMTFGMFILPCFWCHLLCMWPCLLSGKVAAENAIRSQYWILTETELKIVSVDHDQCCCPNLSKTGDIVKTIPLENITDCGLDAKGTGWANQQAGDVPSIYVDTASSGHTNNGNSKSQHEAVGVGLKDYDWLIQQILHQRDQVKQGGGIVAQSMNRPGNSSNKTTQERIQELTGLRDQGIITESEFQQQRQAIISSI